MQLVKMSTRFDQWRNPLYTDPANVLVNYEMLLLDYKHSTEAAYCYLYHMFHDLSWAHRQTLQKWLNCMKPV